MAGYGLSFCHKLNKVKREGSELKIATKKLCQKSGPKVRKDTPSMYLSIILLDTHFYSIPKIHTRIHTYIHTHKATKQPNQAEQTVRTTINERKLFVEIFSTLRKAEFQQIKN